VGESLRVVEGDETSQLSLMDKFTLVDPENEAGQLKNLYSLHLFNVLPEIRTKYSLLAELYFLVVRVELESPHLAEAMSKLNGIFVDLLGSDGGELDVIEYEIYLRYLIEFVKVSEDSRLKPLFLVMLQNYPNLSECRKIEKEEFTGKRRKYIHANQYFKGAFQETPQARKAA
jgi:hypothetical protein